MSQNKSWLSFNTDKSMDAIRPTNEIFANLYQTKKWTDLTITLGSKSFSVHRSIICSAMPYFDTMMSSEFKESRQGHVTLDHSINIEALECLIKWAYSFKININSTNVHSLLVASDYLGITQVFEACCEYLDSVLNIETALQIKGIIRDLEVGKLSSKATALIITNFTIISKTNEWFELPVELLTNYLKNSDAIGFDESEIVDAIIRWAEFSPESRQGHLSSLLKLVNWKFVDSATMVKEIASHDLVRSDESCRKLFFEVFAFMAYQSTENPLSSYWKSPRVHNYNGEVMMAFVKLQDKVQCLVQLPYSKQWKQWMTLDMDLSGEFKVAATDEYLYIHSGDNSVFIHLPSKKHQKTKPAHMHKVTASSIEVFITEDSNDSQLSHVIKSIQCSPSDHKKCDVSTMDHNMDAYGFVYLNNALYSIGGDTKEMVTSAEFQKYDIAQSKWTYLTSMTTPRRNPHAIALDGKIYVIGGDAYWKRSLYPVKSAEYYDPNLNKWFDMPFPSNGDSIKFVIAFCSKLYAFMDTKLKIVHIYDPKTGTWKEDSKDSCCEDVLSVISIPNLTSLIFN